jgi:hypothetical protein
MASIALALGAVGAWFGLVDAREHGNYGALLWWGYLTLGLVVGSTLCIAVPLARRVDVRANCRRESGPALHRPKGEYVARYSTQDRVIAVFLAILFGALTVFIVLHSNRTLMQVVAVTIFCSLVANVLNVIATTVRFTDDCIAARLPWFRSISQPYTAVKKLRAMPGTVHIHFSDGRSLKLHPGLGDPDHVIGYLRTHCSNSVELEDSR